jgi:hypothetical protein
MSLKLTDQLVSTGRSPGLTLNLSSNNPFRNRGSSPTLSPQFAPPRPVSRNPFLDASGAPLPISTSPTMSQANGATIAPKPLTGNAAELFVRHSRHSSFPSLRSCATCATENHSPYRNMMHSLLTMKLQDNLTLNDKNTTSNGMRPAPPPPYTATDKDIAGPAGSARAENIPPSRGGPMHRPTRSQEEAMRARRAATGVLGRPRAPNGELNIFADPESPRKSGERRIRRNSDSSMMERNGKLLDPEEEKKRHERRRRERRHREREREGGKDPKSRPKGRLDIIDQLDATSIYGTGRE